MDTINIILDLRKELNNREIRDVENFIERTGYCDVIRTIGTNKLDIRFSYPRYFSQTNAFLIKSADECFEVQEDFVRTLQKNTLTRKSIIRIVRADVPFTFLMDKGEEFFMYKNIFKIFAEVYKCENLASDPKKIMSMLTERNETLIYADRPDIKNYNQKVMIYNQYKKFRDKANNKKSFQNICDEFQDLPRRMRIEYSTRVPKNRELGKPMSLEEFKTFKVFDIFVPKAIEYILNNLLNEEHIDSILRDKIYELEDKFCYERDNRKIDYERFIYKNIDLILDYSVIRKALNQIENIKTREGVVRSVRRLIREYERENHIIIMGTCDKIREMIEFFYSNPFKK